LYIFWKGKLSKEKESSDIDPKEFKENLLKDLSPNGERVINWDDFKVGLEKVFVTVHIKAEYNQGM